MVAVALQMILCLIIAAIIGFIIGYLLGKSTCAESEEEREDEEVSEGSEPLLLAAARDGEKDNLQLINSTFGAKNTPKEH